MGSVLASRAPLLRFTALLVASFLTAACGGEDGGPTEPEFPMYDLASMTRTESGLYYQDLNVGNGVQAEAPDSVQITYLGWVSTGSFFGGGTFTFELGTPGIIEGFNEGISGMRVTGYRRLVIPPELAYGAEGNGPSIPPNSTLVFEVELLQLVDVDTTSAGGGRD